MKPSLHRLLGTVTTVPHHTPFETVEPTLPAWVVTTGTLNDVARSQIEPRQHVQPAVFPVLIWLTPPLSTADEIATTAAPGAM